MADEKKGITVKIDANLHAEIREYLERHEGMTMAEFITLAVDDELHPKIQQKEGNSIKRIVEDKRYIGDGGYLPILTEQEYAAMQSIKAAKNTQKDVNHTEGIFTLNAPVVCPNCGGRMHRRFDRRRKATTWWQCSECKASVNMSDENMLNGITELLNEVIADPERIQTPKSDHEESQEIKRLNAEISKALNTVSFDKEAIKQKMLTCVSEKYISLGTEEITAQSLKDIFKSTPTLTAYDSNLTHQAVSEIQPKENGTISLILINGQRIGKEKSA